MRYVLFFALLVATLAAVGYFFVSVNKAARTKPEQSRLSWTIAPFLVSVVMGILLFWLVETTLEGRLFGLASLFSFFSEGVPLPGKLAVFCVSIWTCLFLGVAAPGRRLRSRLNTACEKNWSLLLVSFLIVSVFFLWTLRITVLSFMTNDEYGIFTNIIAASQEGIQAATDTFSHFLFCGLLAMLYRIAPAGCWYTLYHLAALFFSLVIIGWCILRKTRELRWSLLPGCLLHFFVCSGLFMYCFAQISFTVTPVVAGSAAIALSLCRRSLKTKAGRIGSDLISILLILLCYLQRKQSGDALLCFWALACVYELIKILFPLAREWKRHCLHLGIYILVVLLLVGGSRALTNMDAYRRDSDFATAEYYRSLIVDFIVEDISFEQFESVGIPRELATLLHGWYFMDERINTDTLKALANVYYADKSAASDTPASALIADLSTMLSSIANDPQMLYRSLCLFSLLLTALFLLLHNPRQNWAEFLCVLCSCGGALIFCMYLVMQGRFLTRVFLVAVLPAIVIALFMVLSMQHPASRKVNRSSGALSALSTLAAGAFFLFCGINLFHVPHATEEASRETLFSTQWAIEEYANSNADICFVTNIYDTNLDPLHSVQYPTNFFLWGNIGETADSPDRLYANDFFRDDVQFMCQTPSYIMFLLQYLSLDHGPVQALDTAHVTDNIYVYDLSRITPGDSYTGWYEQNGLQYYFQNGQALTGTHVIDGVEYEFAPSGDASFLVRVETDEGSVYSTKAYSLITN